MDLSIMIDKNAIKKMVIHKIKHHNWMNQVKDYIPLSLTSSSSLPCDNADTNSINNINDNNTININSISDDNIHNDNNMNI